MGKGYSPEKDIEMFRMQESLKLADELNIVQAEKIRKLEADARRQKEKLEEVLLKLEEELLKLEEERMKREEKAKKHAEEAKKHAEEAKKHAEEAR